MRKALALLLLTTVATPALADPADTIRRGAQAREEARSERQESRREARSNDNSGEPAQSSNQSDGGRREDSPRVHVDRSNDGGNQPTFGGQRGGDETQEVRVNEEGGNQPTFGGQRGGNETQEVRVNEEGGSADTWRGRRIEDRVRVVRPEIVDQGDVGRQPGLRQLERPLPRVMEGRAPVVSRTPREGTQPPLRVENRRRSGNWTSWNHNWRRDRRHDWREHRRRHRSRFHLAIYLDPFGWRYRPYSIGWRLWPSYYSSRYWINDPWFYRLPYAPPGYRWIRYWDDALLVDTWTGEVVDVIHNFFW